MQERLATAAGRFFCVVGVVVDERRYAVSTFSSRHDVTPNQFEATWDEMVQTLTDHRSYPSKHEVWLWSPARYREGARRGREGVEHVSLFVADVDDGTSGDEMAARLMMLGSSFLVVSTWSHTLEHPKLRAVLPLVEPIPAGLYDDVWQRFNEYLFSGHIDPATKDPSRMFYGPSCPRERLGDVYVQRW
jgi:hypothetical protein